MGVGNTVTLLESEFDEYKEVMHDRREKIAGEDAERTLRRAKLEQRLNEKGCTEEEKESCRAKLISKENKCLKAQQHQYRKDDFTLLKTLGQGGFGTVYKVTYKTESKVMALKQMPRSTLSSRNDLEHLFCETNALATIYTSPYFPLLYACFSETDYVYILMEYLEGGDLVGLLQSMQHFPESMTRFYAAELIEAVDFVHRAGYVHRDIKPDNICFTRKGHLKLLDFGLSKEDPGMFLMEEQDAARLLQSHLGTPYYMAPEIVKQKGYSSSVDLWAVGCVIFECMCGQSPFTPTVVRGDTQMSVMKKIFALITSFDTVLPPLYQKYLMKRYLTKNAVALCRGIFAPSNTRMTLHEIRMHPFFDALDFHKLQDLRPPYQPAVKTDNGLVRTQKPRKEEATKILAGTVEALGREDYELTNFAYDVAARAPNENSVIPPS